MKTRTKLYLITSAAILLATTVFLIGLSSVAKRSENTQLCSSATHGQLGLIHLSDDGTQFACAECGSRYIACGFNYAMTIPADFLKTTGKKNGRRLWPISTR